MTADFVPHDYQLPAMDHLLHRRRSALFAPMGGGKTVMTGTALVRLDYVEDVFPALILAPKRVAATTWPDEVVKWPHLQHLRVSCAAGLPLKQRVAALRKDADITTMNYDQLAWLVEFWGDDWPYKTVVADELTRLKSFRIRQGGKRAAALGKVAHSKVTRFIGLTGTPSANGLKDLWGQLWFIDKGERLGKTFSAFEQRWFAKSRDGFGLEPHPWAMAEIMALISDVCLTVDGLPVDEPIRNKLYVDLPPAARSLYRQMEKEMFAEIEGREVSAVHAAARTNKCLQICNGAVYVDPDDHNSPWEALHDAKLDALESVIEEAAGMPVLVAYSFKSDLTRILKRFPQARHLDADPETIRQWNAGKIPVLVAHPASAGHGLNLQYGGNILAFFGIDWGLENHMQIIERIGPQRQKQAGFDRPVFVHYIMAKNTVDDMVFDRLVNKKSVQDALLDGLKRRKETEQC